MGEGQVKITEVKIRMRKLTNGKAVIFPLHKCKGKWNEKNYNLLSVVGKTM